MYHLDMDFLCTVGLGCFRSTDFHIAERSQPASVLAGKPNYFIPLTLASEAALTTFSELPLVLMASSTSPACPIVQHTVKIYVHIQNHLQRNSGGRIRNGNGRHRPS